MARQLKCPQCHGLLELPIDFTDTHCTCGHCQAVIPVPADPFPPSCAGNLGPRPVAPSNGMAIAALICGIAGIITCIPIAGIVGLVLGIIALSRAKREPQTYGGSGMATAGIITGCISMLLVPILLVSILLPSLSRARELSKRMVCASNLTGIYTAYQVYIQDYHDDPPNFQALLDEQLITPEMLTCPSAPGVSPAYTWLPRQGEYVDPREDLNPRNVIAYESTDNHNGEGGNVLFADGHVEFIKPHEKIAELIQETQQRQAPGP